MFGINTCNSVKPFTRLKKAEGRNVTLKSEQLEVCFMSITLYSSIYIYIYIYIYNCRQYCFGLLGLISAVLIARMKVSL